MSKRILTNRELRNKVTGIDIVVPDFEEIGGLMSSSAIYHVIVVTRLFYYKTNQHKESDVVQFMIPRRYEEFEVLYHKLSERFPSVLFPKLPKRSLIVNTSVLNERKSAMNDVLKMVAKTQKLCCSPMVLEFLGVQRPQSKSEITEKAPVTQAESPSIKEQQLQTNNETEDLFVADTSSDTTPKEERTSLSEQERTMLDDPSTSGSATFSSNVVLTIFEKDSTEEAEDDLFTPKDQTKEVLLSSGGDIDVEESDLLDLEEDVDDLLSLSKKSEIKQITKPKPAPRSKPSLKFKSPEKASFEAGNEADDLFSKQVKETETESPQDGAKGEDLDLFRKARKQSLRKPGDNHKSLDDIFSKDDSSGLFSKNDEEDLFSTAQPTALQQEVSSMGEDDISKYINENLDNPEEAKLDL